MENGKPVFTAATPTKAKVGLGLVTVAFAVGLIAPLPAEAQVVWGSIYLNPEQTMGVCVCDGGNYCTPCIS